MLVRFYGKNFRSFRDEFELSMVAADLKGKDDQGRGIIEVPLAGLDEPLKLLRTVAIYGPNASGKSTVLRAASALRWLVAASSANAKPDAKIPVFSPFVLDKESRGLEVSLGCDVVLDGAIVNYEICFDAKSIHRESLSIVNGVMEEPDVLIERLESGEVRGRLIRESEANRLYVTEMQPNVAVISKLAQHGPSRGRQSVRSFHNAIRSALRYRDYSGPHHALGPFTGINEERFADDESYRNWIMNHLIQRADIGICGVHAKREQVEFPDLVREIAEKYQEMKLPEKSVVVSFIHEGDDEQMIDFSDESTGTQKLFHISGDLWMLANSASLESVSLWADELGAGLHPRLLDRLIQTHNYGRVEGSRSQLVFTTHDTGLLEGRDGLPPALRRDQVFFTKKDATGASELYSLVEFKGEARSVHNIRKRYMSGLYGAIPAVEKFSL